uniref:Uncharacterized protein n=1 Tax=Tanacetum cinerariifolium TaxID=118510 RepID=A0A6L2LY62_TANCI|nr:hypothetical protein [Tanacetum cinerariifolium]
MVAILEKSEHNIDFHPIVDFVEASPFREKTNKHTKSTCPLNPKYVAKLARLVTEQGTTTAAATEQATTTATAAGQGATTTTANEEAATTTIVSEEAIADEPASPLRDVSQREACPTDSGFIADQDRATITKPSTLPHDSAPRVTSPAAEEGTQEVEINRLKERVKILVDKEGVIGDRSGDDAPIKRRRIDEEEVATERVSSDTKEVRLDEGEVAAKRFMKTQKKWKLDVVPTASPVFSTATVVTPYRRRKCKEVMVESETPKKQKLPEQIDAQIARELKEQLKREDQRRSEQIAKDEEIARIHAKEELQIMIDGLDRNNLGWKAKDFKGMSFEEVEAKFKTVWEQIEGGVSKISEGEAAWLKRKGIRSEQESAKKHKLSEEVPEEVKSSDKVRGEKLKEMM